MASPLCRLRTRSRLLAGHALLDPRLAIEVEVAVGMIAVRAVGSPNNRQFRAFARFSVFDGGFHLFLLALDDQSRSSFSSSQAT